MSHPSFHRGRWMIERERFQLDETARPERADRTREIRDPLRSVMKQLGLHIDATLKDLIDHWPEVVGPQIAAHSRPGKLDQKELIVYVSHPMWMQELQRFHFKAIQEKIRARAGAHTVRSIRIQLDANSGR